MIAPRLRLFNVLAWVVAVLACWRALTPLSHHQQPREWYVSVQGSDLWGDGSRAKPWRSIQFAGDLAIPGDRISVLPGTYRERVHLRRGGTLEQPVKLVADPPGSVVITAACPENECTFATWLDEGRGIYSTEIGWPIHMVTVGGQQLFRVPWGGLNQLRELVKRPAAKGAFWFEAGRLFVGLPQGQHPNGAALVWHQRVPPPREWGEFKSANVWVEADHVVLSGLRLEFGLGAAVRVWNGSHLLVEDCEFTGCTYGVLAGAGVKPARHLRINRCWYHNSPQADWGRDWLTWGEVYGAYASSTLCGTNDQPVSIRDNLVTDFGDGLRISPSVDPDVEGSAELVGNWLAFGTDDAFELDGPGHRMLIEDNVVIDVHEGISLSPLTEGPVLIVGNLFWNPVGGLNGSQLKFIPPEILRGPAARIQRVTVEDNVFCGEWLSWRGDVSVSDVLIRRNVFQIDRQISPPWPPGVVDEANVYRVPRDVTVTTAAMFLESLAGDGRNPEAALTARAMKKLLVRRPGPRWLNWENHPTTNRLLQLTRAD